MKASAEYSTSSASSMRVRRGSIFGLPYFFWISSQLLADQLPAAVFVLEQRRDLAGALALVGQLVLDDEDLEARQPIQLQFEDRVGLLGVEREALHDLLGRVGLAVRLADDLDDLVERVEDLLEALEDVDALLRAAASSCSRRLVTTSRRKWRKCQSICLRSSRSGRPTSAFSVGTRHVMLTANVVCSEVFLKRYAITRFSSALALQLQLDPHVVGRHVLDVDQVRHLAAEHDVADLLDELRLVDRVRNAGDVELLAASARRPRLPGARAGESIPSRSGRSPSARRAS